MVGVVQSYPGLLNDSKKGYIQKTAGTYKNEKPTNNTGIDEVHPKCVCVNRSNGNGNRGPVLYSFALVEPPAYKMYKEPKIKFFRRVNKPVLSHITICLGDDDHKAVILMEKL